jgi:hypothetical protein
MGGGLIIGEATDGLTYGVRVDTDGRLVTTSLFTEIAKGNVGDAAGPVEAGRSLPVSTCGMRQTNGYFIDSIPGTG